MWSWWLQLNDPQLYMQHCWLLITTELRQAVLIRHHPWTISPPVPKEEESFIIFHADGYTMHEPRECLTQRHVKPDFGNFHFLPDELSSPPQLCRDGIPCMWGDAVTVGKEFVYVTQPQQNRVVVIDVRQTLNPNQVRLTTFPTETNTFIRLSLLNLCFT